MCSLVIFSTSPLRPLHSRVKFAGTFFDARCRVSNRSLADVYHRHRRRVAVQTKRAHALQLPAETRRENFQRG